MKVRHIKRALFGYIGCPDTLKAAPYKRWGSVWQHAWAVGHIGGKRFLATGAKHGLTRAFEAAEAGTDRGWIVITKPGQHPTWGELCEHPLARG